jgi:hypothetical protein
MKKLMILTLALSTALWMGACGKPDQTGHDKDKDTNGEKKEDDGDKGGGHDHVGDVTSLGGKSIGAWSVEVEQIGDIKPDSVQAIFKINITGPDPAIVRAQLVSNDDKKSIKAKANRLAAGKYDVHVTQLPKPLAKGSQLVVELEDANGAVEWEQFATSADEE